jgi:FtsH-binding integral membrane protein
MTPSTGRIPPPEGWARHRHAIRYAAAALSAGCALVYFLIGFGAIYPVEDVSADAPSLLFFGVPAGLAFALGAILLLATDRRGLWILGAVFQVFVIVAYLAVAEKRDPPFEAWGILLKVAQVAILGALVYLAAQPVPGPSVRPGEASTGSPSPA